LNQSDTPVPRSKLRDSLLEYLSTLDFVVSVSLEIGGLSAELPERPWNAKLARGPRRVSIDAARLELDYPGVVSKMGDREGVSPVTTRSDDWVLLGDMLEEAIAASVPDEELVYVDHDFCVLEPRRDDARPHLPKGNYRWSASLPDKGD
jgi:hypothetical protein